MGETNITAVDGMTCGCARQAETLKQLGCDMKVQYEGDSQESRARYSHQYRECMDSRDTQYFIGQLRCDPNGNFDTAQCISQVSHEPSSHRREVKLFLDNRRRLQPHLRAGDVLLLLR